METLRRYYKGVDMFVFLKSLFTFNFWYHPYLDMWFPKCILCKGKRLDTCPPDCMGDESG